MKKQILGLVILFFSSITHSSQQSFSKASWTSCQVQGKKCYTLLADTIDITYFLSAEMWIARNVTVEFYDKANPAKRGRMTAEKGLWKASAKQWILIQGKLENSKGMY
jgi:hypothetical protein